MEARNEEERKTLWIVLAINAGMFVLEVALGWLAQSTGLIADSLDMFADASVYAISLYAAGKSAALQAGSARLSGAALVGRNNQRALRRMVFQHSAQCATLIARQLLNPIVWHHRKWQNFFDQLMTSG